MTRDEFASMSLFSKMTCMRILRLLIGAHTPLLYFTEKYSWKSTMYSSFFYTSYLYTNIAAFASIFINIVVESDFYTLHLVNWSMSAYGPVTLYLNWESYTNENKSMYLDLTFRVGLMVSLSLISIIAGELVFDTNILFLISEWLLCSSGIIAFISEELPFYKKK